MAQLIVRKLEPAVVAALRRRAAQAGRSMEAEHREILREALRGGGKKKSLKALLLELPAVGSAADFARISGRPRRVEL
jgi:plasmid stability protein